MAYHHMTRGAFSSFARLLAIVGGCLVLANCSSNIDPRLGVAPSPRVVAAGQPIPKGGGRYYLGKPYTVGGKIYTPREEPNYKSEGLASWYGSDFHGRLTANGEVYDNDSLSAAHPTLPLPSYVRVTNTANGKSVVVRVNDRGPFHSDRLIDVSRRTAEILDFQKHGMAKVRVEYIGRADLNGSDDKKLLATYRDGSNSSAPSDATAIAALRSSVGTPASNAATQPKASTSIASAAPMGGPYIPAPQAVATPAVISAPSDVSPKASSASVQQDHGLTASASASASASSTPRSSLDSMVPPDAAPAAAELGGGSTASMPEPLAPTSAPAELGSSSQVASAWPLEEKPSAASASAPMPLMDPTSLSSRSGGFTPPRLDSKTLTPSR